MSDTGNPYEAPQAEIAAVPQTERHITEVMTYHLKGASPWLRFVGIVGFIFAGLGALGILAGLISFSAVAGIPGVGELAGTSPVLLLVYLPFIVILFFQSLFTFRFGTNIRSWLQSGDNGDLEAGLKNNKSLYTLNGVCYIIGLAFIALVLVIVIIAAVVAASNI